MSLDPRCASCFEKNLQRLKARFPLTSVQENEFSQYFTVLLSNPEPMLTPEFQRQMQSKLSQLNGIADPYKQEKQASNQIAMELYREWKPKVIDSPDPFQLALRLALAGNVMDYAVHQHFDLEKTIHEVIQVPLAIDDSLKLKKRIRAAKRIIYLGDNAGEIVFDRLLIETIMHPFVTFVVRGGPAINDATLEDIAISGIDLVSDVISNGYNAPSTIVGQSSPAFRQQYESADLIISKGQGNFEGLMESHDPRIFFLLMVKCDLVAERLGVQKGSFVVVNHGKN
jgi:uncharacterized protein with ATP-grasp and redox domains